MFEGEVTDKQLKEAVLHEARTRGCDFDGDLVYYKGGHYYVDISRDIVIRR